MRKMLYIIICVPLLLLAACDIHQWPEQPENVTFRLRLDYETEMTKWEHLYDGADVVEQGLGEIYDNHLGYGEIRYIVRAYPVTEKQRTAQYYTQEFVFTKDIAEGYDHEITLELPAGNYNIMVWSDLVKTSGDIHFHNADNFAEIVLQDEHMGNTDHRDAFRGSAEISLVSDIVERVPDVVNIAMQRPLAKYEFLTTDLKEFIDKEYEYLQNQAASRGETPPSRVNTDDYKVVVYYSGYMPFAYNMNTDKPIDSKMGVSFDAKFEVLNENEASLGFDYVFVNGKASAVTVQIGLYDKEGRRLALSDPINVPLQRNRHTLLKGSFLMQETSGGIIINPDFDGNHNIVID